MTKKPNQDEDWRELPVRRLPKRPVVASLSSGASWAESTAEWVVIEITLRGFDEMMAKEVGLYSLVCVEYLACQR